MPNTPFTPEQIAQILEEFFKTVGTRQYIGSRYVPIFGRKDEDSIEWDNSGTYEPLTIVLYQGNSYTSRQFVPVGVDITNQEFWALTGNYNAQVEQYRRETAAAMEAAQAAQADIDTLLPKSEFDADNTVKDYVDNLASVIPSSAFDANSTVKDYVDDLSRVIPFNTVADMQAATNLKAGFVCHTNGFHSRNDGGGSYYLISEQGTADGMTVLACANNLLALLVVPDTVFPEMLGAHGDGVADDTAIIQYAIHTYRRVSFVGRHTYLLSAPITISRDSTTINGNDCTLVVNADNAFIIDGDLPFIYISNFRIVQCASFAIRSTGGVKYSRFENLQLRQCHGGIAISGVNYVNVINNISCFNNVTNPLVSASNSIDLQIKNVSGVGYMTFIDCTRLGLDSCAIDGGTPCFTFDNCSANLNNCSTETYGYSIRALKSALVTINGGYYEGHFGDNFQGWFKVETSAKIIADTSIIWSDYAGSEPTYKYVFQITSGGRIDFTGNVKITSYTYQLFEGDTGGFSYNVKNPQLKEKRYNINNIDGRAFAEPLGSTAYRKSITILLEGAVSFYNSSAGISGVVNATYDNSQWNLETYIDAHGYIASGNTIDQLKPTFRIEDNQILSNLASFNKYDIDFRVIGFN